VESFDFLIDGFNRDATGPGNVILIEESSEHVTEITTGFGEKGVSAEQVAQDTIEALRRHQASGAIVGEYLADQLLIPFALAGSGEFITAKPSSHAVTNAQTIAKFLDRKIGFREDTEKTWRCVIEYDKKRGSSVQDNPRSIYSTRKCFQSEMLCTFRMKNVLGSSLGAVGDLSKRRPTSSGRRSALRLFTSLLANTQFSHEVLPPRERGRM
jgi:hypothetical protein